MVAAGDRLGGHLLVERVLDSGGLSVWSARTPDGEQVFVEVAPLFAGGSAFEGERDAALQIVHEQLNRVLEVGVEGEQRFVVSDFVEGRFLSPLLVSAREAAIGTSPGVAGAIARQIARALSVLHGAARADGGPRGRFPHPIDPRAVIVERSGAVKVGRLFTADRGLAEAGFTAPETASGAIGDGRADFFGVGVLLWTMLAGRELFVGTDPSAILDTIRKNEVPRLPAYVPARLAGVTMRCLARVPEERFESADLLEAALEAATIDQPDADRVGIAAYLADLEAAASGGGRPRTFQLSEASQSGAPRNAADTAKSDPPSTIRSVPDGQPATADEFFDADRDGGTISNPRFEVLGRLGSGGMGEVYRVRDLELNEVVALKLIPTHAASEMQSLERLKREVRLARRIASEHVCRIFDLVDLGHGSRGLTMALIDGTTLSDLLKTGLQIDYLRFAKWGADIANGLAAAHAVDIIHRDLKPENVMINAEDRAVILDFGIARSQAEKTDVAGKLTQAGIIMGTPLYMSPEQLANRELDGRSDLYALGLLLGELVTGEVPLPGEGYADILDRRVVKASEHRYRIRDIDPTCPEGLAIVIDQLVLAAAADRPTDAAATEALLRKVVRGESIPPPAGPPATVDSRPPTSTDSIANGAPMATPVGSGPSKWLGIIALLGAAVIVLGAWLYQDVNADARIVDAGFVTPVAETDAGTVDAGTPDAGTKRDAGRRRSRPPPVEEM